jgi:hypothetical protein
MRLNFAGEGRILGFGAGENQIGNTAFFIAL